MFNEQAIEKIKSQFPIFSQPTPTLDPLIYLDNAATALKPQCVIDTVNEVLTRKTANIHRSVHFLGDLATEAYEESRHIVSAFLGCEPNEVVFLRNSTEGLNLIAKAFLGKGKVISSVGEHHSNYLPWDAHQVHRLAIDSLGNIDYNELEQVLSLGEIGLVSLCHISNVTGIQIDAQRVCELAHYYGAKVLIDAAQSAAHTPIDVTELDCDFLVFSGHKLGAPTGVGVLYGKAELLEEMGFWLKGGATIESIENGVVQAKNSPWKFESGTPAIESVAGLKSALLFLMELDMKSIHEHQKGLSSAARGFLQDYLAEAQILGSKDKVSGLFSIYMPGISPHVLARGVSDRYSICIRSGFHCAQPLHQALNVPASLRISPWIYNSEHEIKKTVQSIASLANVVK